MPPKAGQNNPWGSKGQGPKHKGRTGGSSGQAVPSKQPGLAKPPPPKPRVVIDWASLPPTVPKQVVGKPSLTVQTVKADKPEDVEMAACKQDGPKLMSAQPVSVVTTPPSTAPVQESCATSEDACGLKATVAENAANANLTPVSEQVVGSDNAPVSTDATSEDACGHKATVAENTATANLTPASEQVVSSDKAPVFTDDVAMSMGAESDLAPVFDQDDSDGGVLFSAEKNFEQVEALDQLQIQNVAESIVEVDEPMDFDNDDEEDDCMEVDNNGQYVTSEDKAKANRAAAMGQKVEFSRMQALLKDNVQWDAAFAGPLLAISGRFLSDDLMRDVVIKDPDMSNPLAFGIGLSTAGLPDGAIIVRPTFEDWLSLAPWEDELTQGGWYAESMISVAVGIHALEVHPGAWFCEPSMLYEWIGEHQKLEQQVEGLQHAIDAMEEGEPEKIANVFPCEGMPAETEMVVTVINVRRHWIVVSLNPGVDAYGTGVITYHDSMECEAHDEIICKVMPLLADLIGSRPDLMWPRKWTVRRAPTVQQANGRDCGPIAVYYCKTLLCGEEPVTGIRGPSAEDFGRQLRYELLQSLYPRLMGAPMTTVPKSTVGAKALQSQATAHVEYDQIDPQLCNDDPIDPRDLEIAQLRKEVEELKAIIAGIVHKKPAHIDDGLQSLEPFEEYTSRCAKGCTHEEGGLILGEGIDGRTGKAPRFCQTRDYETTRRHAYARYGYTDYDALNNDMFPIHSREYHKLHTFLSIQPSMRAYFAWLDDIVVPNPQGGWSKECRPWKALGAPVNKTFQMHCPDPRCELICGKLVRVEIARLRGIVQLPGHEMWRAVIRRKDTRTDDMPCEQLSGMCNQYGSTDDNHCIHKKHVKLEVVAQNALRKSHHGSYEACLGCNPPCIGPDVMRSWTHLDWVRAPERAGVTEPTPPWGDDRSLSGSLPMESGEMKYPLPPKADDVFSADPLLDAGTCSFGDSEMACSQENDLDASSPGANRQGAHSDMDICSSHTELTQAPQSASSGATCEIAHCTNNATCASEGWQSERPEYCADHAVQFEQLCKRCGKKVFSRIGTRGKRTRYCAGSICVNEENLPLVCQEPGCEDTRVWCGQYCLSHDKICLIAGCTEARIRGNVTGPFCMKHEGQCQQPGCSRRATQHHEFCSRHVRHCRLCKVRACRRSWYCGKHGDGATPEEKRTDSSSTIANGVCCGIAGCNSMPIGAGPGWLSERPEYCIDHAIEFERMCMFPACKARLRMPYGTRGTDQRFCRAHRTWEGGVCKERNCFTPVEYDEYCEVHVGMCMAADCTQPIGEDSSRFCDEHKKKCAQPDCKHNISRNHSRRSYIWCDHHSRRCSAAGCLAFALVRSSRCRAHEDKERFAEDTTEMNAPPSESDAQPFEDSEHVQGSVEQVTVQPAESDAPPFGDDECSVNPLFGPADDIPSSVPKQAVPLGDVEAQWQPPSMAAESEGFRIAQAHAHKHAHPRPKEAEAIVDSEDSQEARQNGGNTGPK